MIGADVIVFHKVLESMPAFQKKWLKQARIRY
mgnify:CR=1 FL=1